MRALALLALLALLQPAAAQDRAWGGWEDVSESAWGVSSPDCRVALVVGNAQYAHANELPNAVADARAVADVLEQVLHFDVVRDFDQTHEAFTDLVQDFESRIRPGCATLVYYSGHAVQGASGENYLLPVDIPSAEGSDLRLRAISLQDVQATMKDHRAGARLAFLDACRTLRFDDERGGRPNTLQPINAGRGAFTGYATAAGTVARDGVPGSHSPFTAAFLEWVRVPGLTVEQVFNGIQGEFIADRGQVPDARDQLLGDFYFLPPVDQPAEAPIVETHYPRQRMISPSGIPLRWVPPVGEREATTGGRWVMEIEFPQGQLEALGLKDHSRFDGDALPVETVSWCDAVAIANALSDAEELPRAYAVPAGFKYRMESCPDDEVRVIEGSPGYRLLSDAEWTWAARAGEDTTYPGGDEVGAVAWYDDNSKGTTHAGCTRDPNAWSLCDMGGNVWEWVFDSIGQFRVYRGGAWYGTESGVRASYRFHFSPGDRSSGFGFRLSRSE